MSRDPLDTPDTDECFIRQSDDCTGVATTLRQVIDGLRDRRVPVCDDCARELDNENDAAYERSLSDFYGGTTLTVQQRYEQAAKQKVEGR